MERLTQRGLGPRLTAAMMGAAWELGRAARALVRRWGLRAPVCLALAVGVMVALAVARHYENAAQQLTLQFEQRAAATPAAPLVATAAPLQRGEAGARGRLQAFEAQLLPQGEIPFVVQELLELGAAEGLSMQRGTYRWQPDTAGGFARYRMSLPVKGSGRAIQRFMKVALRRQHNLALDSVQFTRAAIGTSDIEARIQWVLLVAPPSALAVAAAEQP